MPNAQAINHAQLTQMRAAQANAMNLPMQQIQAMQAVHHPQQAHNMQQMQQHQQQLIAAQQQAQQAALHAQQRQAAAQQMQISHSQEQNTQQPQSQTTPAPQTAPQPQQQPTPQASTQQSQPAQPQQGQPSANQQQPPQQQQTQQQQQQGQVMQQQREQQMAQQEAINQQKANQVMRMQQLQKPIVGLSILRLVQYQDHLGKPEKPDDLEYWQGFVAKFFSPEGVVRQQLYNNSTHADKRFRIEYPSLPRFYRAHFSGGIKQIWMSVLGAAEKNLNTGGHTVWSDTASTKYVYNNDNVIITSGSLRVNFDAENRIEYLDITMTKWVEYVPRLALQVQEPVDQKQSPKTNKNLKRQASKPAPPQPGISVPDSIATEYGVPRLVVQFLEV